MKKILVLFGGHSFEHEISVRSCKTIMDNIDRDKYDVTLCGISKDGDFYLFLDDISYLDRDWLNRKVQKIDNIISFIKSFDKVFPIIHGMDGEDGKIQGLLDIIEVPYVGPDNEGNIIGYDKAITKIICEKSGIPQLPYIVLYNDNKVNSIPLKFPVIVKPSRCGSSIGIGVANNIDELNKCIKNAYKYDNKIIVEKYVHKRRELECAVLGKKEIITSSVGEIILDDGFYDYDSKYVKDTNVGIPANLDKNMSNRIKNLAKKIFIILDLKDLSRVDFLYDMEDNSLYFNEVNTIPGFTSISMYPLLFDYDGINTKELITRLIED